MKIDSISVDCTEQEWLRIHRYHFFFIRAEVKVIAELRGVIIVIWTVFWLLSYWGRLWAFNERFHWLWLLLLDKLRFLLWWTGLDHRWRKLRCSKYWLRWLSRYYKLNLRLSFLVFWLHFRIVLKRWGWNRRFKDRFSLRNRGVFQDGSFSNAFNKSFFNVFFGYWNFTSTHESLLTIFEVWFSLLSRLKDLDSSSIRLLAQFGLQYFNLVFLLHQ